MLLGMTEDDGRDVSPGEMPQIEGGPVAAVSLWSTHQHIPAWPLQEIDQAGSPGGGRGCVLRAGLISVIKLVVFVPTVLCFPYGNQILLTSTGLQLDSTAPLWELGRVVSRSKSSGWIQPAGHPLCEVWATHSPLQGCSVSQQRCLAFLLPTWNFSVVWLSLPGPSFSWVT